MNASQFDERSGDVGLLFLRVSGGLFLLCVHGMPKLLDYTAQLQLIEDPFHLGAHLTLILAIFAEVLCPLLVVAGVPARLASCLFYLCCWWRYCSCIRNGLWPKGSSAGCC